MRECGADVAHHGDVAPGCVACGLAIGTDSEAFSHLGGCRAYARACDFDIDPAIEMYRSWAIRTWTSSAYRNGLHAKRRVPHFQR